MKWMLRLPSLAGIANEDINPAEEIKRIDPLISTNTCHASPPWQGLQMRTSTPRKRAVIDENMPRLPSLAGIANEDINPAEECCYRRIHATPPQPGRVCK